MVLVWLFGFGAVAAIDGTPRMRAAVRRANVVPVTAYVVMAYMVIACTADVRRGAPSRCGPPSAACARVTVKLQL